MKSALFGLCVCFLLLQGCSQQKGAETSSTTTTTGTSGSAKEGQTGQSTGGISAEQMNKMPKSQQYFVQSRTALDQHKPKECFELLGKAAEAAKAEKDYVHVCLCYETQARLKMTEQDTKGAVAALEAGLKDMDQPTSDLMLAGRLDAMKALLASLYAIEKEPAKAEGYYKKMLAVSRNDKPVNHHRVAFWLRNYSDYYKYKKDDKKASALLKEAAAETAKAGGPAGSEAMRPQGHGKR